MAKKSKSQESHPGISLLVLPAKHYNQPAADGKVDIAHAMSALPFADDLAKTFMEEANLINLINLFVKFQ